LEQESTATAPPANRTGVVLGTFAALLIIASAILLIVAGTTHYLAKHRTGSEVTLETSAAQRSSAPPPPRAANTAAAPPAAIATAPATPTSAGVIPTEKTVISSGPSASEQRTNATTPQSTEPAGTQNTTVQPSVRDHAAALPDPPAVTPKKENVFIVMRGPAQIRSDPGKKGRVIGTAPKNATVKELGRAGNWVRIEAEAGTGWINAALLGSPESR